MPLTVLLATNDDDRWAGLDDAIRSMNLRVQAVDSGEDVLRLRQDLAPSLVLISTELPDLHALDVCRRIRRDSDVPLIVLASETGDFDRVLALELGADDVVADGCRTEELQERVKAALRRGTGVEVEQDDGDVLDFGEVVIDRASHQLRVEDQCEDLTPMETELLWMLGRHAGEVVESEALLQDVWGYPPGVKTRTLDVHIGRLRKKLGEDGRNPRYIITVRSVGYRFEPAPDEDEDDEVAA